MNKYLLLSLTLVVLTRPVFAQMSDSEDCDPEIEDCRDSEVKEAIKNIYPTKPFETSRIRERLEAITENKNFLWNLEEMSRRGLNKANTKVQPWGGSFWPLYQGQIANTYQDKNYDIFITDGLKAVRWQSNVKAWKNRKENVLSDINELDEEDLARLAPSEKYDLLLGDTSFDLTNRIWDFAEKWGNEKKWGFLSMIDLPEGYRVPDANNFMALWEGICHGWTPASGHHPRPEKTVTVTLPNGKRMPFYPNDIKALISLMWANSTIQGNVIFEGNRCNRKNPDTDKHGRFIDTELDKDDTTLLPRCADVHPAIFHIAAVNLIGVEGRSFGVDHNPKAPIANQPVSGYELKYFNPKTGKEKSLQESIISVEEYGKKDKFKESRNPETTHIVGVEMKVFYVDWEYPRLKETNSPSDDKIKDFKFKYDLELNAQGNIIGGQWRVTKKGGDGFLGIGEMEQPDFFWVVPKDWKEYFRPVEGLPTWNFTQSTVPPKEYKAAAHAAHSFFYEESKKFWGVSPKCPAFPVEGGDPIKVDCEFRYPRPQPLIQVVDKLLEMSRQ